MPSRRSTIPPEIDQIEKDFRAALLRLQANTPKNKELRKKSAAGKLKILIHSVALEAGHSRTHLSLENCRYPVTRDLILRAKQPATHQEPTTYSELIGRLRAEKASLKKELGLFKDEAARQFNLRIAIDKKNQEAQAQISRLQRKLAALGNIRSFDDN